MKFLILDQDGNIEVETKDFADPLTGLEAASRFLSSFRNDPKKRVVRVMADGEVIATYDSEFNTLTFGRPKQKR